jgi:ketosteroid isomerase-like protein
VSQENVDKATRAIRGDPTDFFDLLDDEVEVDLTNFPLPDYAGVIHGREDAIHMWRRYWGAWTDYSLRLEEAIDAGDNVVIVMHEAGTGKASGVSLERTWANVWTFRQGKLVHFRACRTKEEALEAAGLRG